MRLGGNVLRDSLPGLLQALDGLSQAHPYISAAVFTFRVIIKLNIDRHDNDRKIELLFLSMRDMMNTVCELRVLKNGSVADRTGKTLQENIKTVIDQAENDMKACANACDVYARKTSIAKVVAASLWNKTLAGYVTTFKERRDDFLGVLSLYTAVTIADMDRKLDDVGKRLQEMGSTLETAVTLLAQAVSPEQRRLDAYIRTRGGTETVINDDNALLDLQLRFEGHRISKGTKAAARGDVDSSAHSLRRSTVTNPALHLDQNSIEYLKNKFELQFSNLQRNVEHAITDATNTMLVQMRSGAHDQVVDPVIQALWKEMRWPGQVKARHFVFALHDKYRRELRNSRTQPTDLGMTRLFDSFGITRKPVPARPISNSDEWALEHINIHRLQAINEAFDDDGSGFITLAEVNEFTGLCPKNWSLPHWLAYWAIGWQASTSEYIEKVLKICAKMFAMRSEIHADNRVSVHRYLDMVWKKICTLASSFNPTRLSSALRERFQDYVDAEEARLREGLVQVKYRIDAPNTLSLILGQGRVEKSLMPLIYLLLTRHLQLFTIAKAQPIHENELWDAGRSLERVFSAVNARHDELEALFSQQHFDPDQKFKVFANELFDYWHDGSEFWSVQNLRKLVFLEADDYPDVDPAIDPSKVLNYGQTVNTGPRLPEALRDTLTQAGTTCDACRLTIRGPRVVCLECGVRATFDFCDKPECTERIVRSRDDIVSPHLPSHDCVKICAPLNYYRDIGAVLRKAAAGLERARTLMTPAPALESQPVTSTGMRRDPVIDCPLNLTCFGTFCIGVKGPTCVSCRAAVLQPCWYCIDCPDEADTFICKTCEESGKGGFSDSQRAHNGTHNRVRCTEVDQKKHWTTRDRLVDFEGQLSALREQMDRVEDALRMARSAG
ncbi:hypothetical protein C8Q76DRAFT_663578 [Earliella scabrosa]|nr:hypothetical protein C8Q76DRAFT_663578 [Earliella scabrosa]